MHVNGNATSAHQNVALLSLATTLADRITTSAEIESRLGATLKRLRLPTGLLQRVAGITERRNWAEGQSFETAAIAAGEKALAEAGIDASEVGLLINTSVTRKHLEPSVAVRMHHGLGLPSSAINFDLANACLGFVNGMSLAAQLIEFASLTLGSGAAAALLGPADLHASGHRILGGVTRAATQFNDLCVGSVNGMYTDAKALLKGGMELVVAAWQEAKKDWDWSSMDRYILHQVSSIHTDAIVKAAGLDRTKVPITYPQYGNVGPASIPITLSREAATLSPGDRVLLMGVGSGLNTAMMEIAW